MISSTDIAIKEKKTCYLRGKALIIYKHTGLYMYMYKYVLDIWCHFELVKFCYISN